MSLLKITHFFDGLRDSNNNDLDILKDRVRDLVKAKIGYEFTKENIQVFVEELLAGNDKVKSCVDNEMISEQLHRSLEGITPGEETSDTFIEIWDYWLREKPSRTTTLMIVDVQNDFISGSLALKHCPAAEDGYDVVIPINNILSQKLFDNVIYTLDWHPPDHCSFVDNVHKYPVHESSPIGAKEAKTFDTVVYSEPIVVQQKLWPVHCVQNTWGAELHNDLKAPEKEDYITKKGFQSYVDSYSAFWSTGHLHQTELFRVLLKKQVTDVYICGLALDICARFTARDALYLGFNTHLIEDACRSTCPHARCQAKEDFTKDGIHLLDSKDLADHVHNQVVSR